jgi:hypothetical protein
VLTTSPELALNKYAPIPASLQNPSSNAAIDEMPVDMAALIHHYYLDTRGHAPPDPDPVYFEHLSFFCGGRHVRLKGDGIGPRSRFAYRARTTSDRRFVNADRRMTPIGFVGPLQAIDFIDLE